MVFSAMAKPQSLQPRAEVTNRQIVEKEKHMKYGELNLGQIEALVNKLGGMDGVKRFLAGTIEVVTKGILALVNGAVKFDAVDTHDPQAFYQTRAGLWVSDEFRSRILSKAKPVKKLAATVGKSYDLTQNAYDRGITAGLPEGYAFDESEVCARIATLIQKQSKGEADDPLNNGYWNLFYVAGCVVDLRWNAGLRGWSVSAWGLGDDHWAAGDRVFSRN